MKERIKVLEEDYMESERGYLELACTVSEIRKDYGNLCFKKHIANKGRSNKNDVRKYKGKNGDYTKEYNECLNWIKNELFKNLRKRQTPYYYEKCIGNILTRENDIKRRHTKTSIDKKLKSKVNFILCNRQFKVYKDKASTNLINNGYVYFDKSMLAEFLIILWIVYDEKEFLEDFISISDVFYVLRNIRKTGIEYYLY